jgi:RNA recognition motif-containing protein
MATTTIFVGDLSYFCEEKHLLDLFSPFGPVLSVIVRRGKEGNSLQYAFVIMSEADAYAACVALNGSKFMGRKLRLNISNSQQQRCTPLDRRMWFQLHVRFKMNTSHVVLNEVLLEEIFCQFGPVADVTVKEYHVNGESPSVTGYAFVYYYTADVASAALQAINQSAGSFSGAIHFRCNFAYDVKDGGGNVVVGRQHGYPISGGMHPTHVHQSHFHSNSSSALPYSLPPPHSRRDQAPDRASELDPPRSSRFGHVPDTMRGRVESYHSNRAGDEVRMPHRPPGIVSCPHHQNHQNQNQNQNYHQNHHLNHPFMPPPSASSRHPSSQRIRTDDVASMSSLHVTRDMEQPDDFPNPSMYSDHGINVNYDRHQQLDRVAIDRRGNPARSVATFTQPAAISATWNVSPTTSTTKTTTTTTPTPTPTATAVLPGAANHLHTFHLAAHPSQPSSFVSGPSHQNYVPRNYPFLADWENHHDGPFPDHALRYFGKNTGNASLTEQDGDAFSSMKQFSPSSFSK